MNVEMVACHVLLKVPKKTSWTNVATGYVLHLQHWTGKGTGFCMYLSDAVNPCLLKHFL